MVLSMMPFLAANWPFILVGMLCFISAHMTFAPGLLRRKNNKHRRIPSPVAEAELRGAGAEGGPRPALPVDLKHVPLDYARLPEAMMVERAASFYRLMDKRRTVRAFSSEPVPAGILEDIIRAAGTAPSGAHTEPWTFVLVSTASLRQQIRDIVESEEFVNYTQRMGEQWTTDLQPLRTNWEKQYLTDAPHLILVFKQQYSIREDGARKNHYYNELSVAIASGILIAAAHNAGLVTLTSTPLNCGPALRALLARPANEKLVLLLPVGYPADNAQVPDLKRKPLDDILVRL